MWMILLSVVLILAVIFELWTRSQKPYKLAVLLPGPKMYPLIGDLLSISSLNPEEGFLFARKMEQTYQRSYRLFIAGEVNLNVIRYKEAEVFLSSPKFIMKSRTYDFLHPLMGTGLLCSFGLKWVQRRKILTPAFHFNILQQFSDVFKEESSLFVDKLLATEQTSTVIVLQPTVSRFTLNTICETAMGVKLDAFGEADVYRKNIYAMGEALVYRLFRPWLYRPAMYSLSGHKSRLDTILKPVHGFSHSIINQRRIKFQAVENKAELLESLMGENIYETKKQRYAMLDTLLMAESDGKIDDEGIREEVDTFMFEGHDTTASGLVFLLFLLAHHPETQDRLLTEIQEIIDEKNEQTLKMIDYNKMKYMDMVIKEAFRIYPPVPFIQRQLHEDMTMDGLVYPAGTGVSIHIFGLHRDPEVFPDPEKFDPDRFLPENVADRNPYSYVPFSAGPRNCIGQKFAILEIKALVTNILLNFRLKAITQPEDIVFIADLVLRSKTPIKVAFEARHAHKHKILV